MKVIIISLIGLLLMGCDDKPCDQGMHEEQHLWFMPMTIGSLTVLTPQYYYSCEKDK